MHYNRTLRSITRNDDERVVIDEAMQLQSFFKAALSTLVVNDPGAGKPHMMMGGLRRIHETNIRAQLYNFGYADRPDQRRDIIMDSASEAMCFAQAIKGFDLLTTGHHPKNRLLAFLKDSTEPAGI